MKRIFKFFPVALAAFALASCSSDDLNVTNSAGELLNVDGKLLVQVDGGDEGTMRGGFMTTVNPETSTLRTSFFFSEGDQLKLYHDATSWKPEKWTATAFGQYKNAEGIAVFEKTDAEIKDEENAYGIFPADLGQFGNENRTSLKYDLSGLKFIDYAAEAKDFDDGTVDVKAVDDPTGNTKAYRAPFPLWGVKKAGAKVMTVKHLAGILRLDLASMDNSTISNTTARYIVIQSTNKLTGDLATAADVFDPQPAEAVDPDNLMKKAPKLVTEAATGTTPLTAVPTTKTGIANDDIIVVELSKKATTDPALPNHVMLFVPITDGNAGGDVKIYVSNIVAKGTTLDLTSATHLAKKGDGVTDAIYTLDAAKIKEENEVQLSGFDGLAPAEQSKVQAGVFYRINDDSSNKNTTAKTPFELAKGIIAADKAAYRDFEITFTQPINVKNNDGSPQNFYLDLTNTVTDYLMSDYPDGWELKHNVTVNLTLKESDDAGSVPSVLYVKTKGGKKLTLNITNDVKKIDRIEIKDGDLKSPLILTAASSVQLPNLTLGADNNDLLTLKAGVPVMYAKSNFVFDCPNFNTSDRLTELRLSTGFTKLTALSGNIGKISLNGTDKIDRDVTIYTEGKVGINVVDYSNMPKTTTAGKTTDTYNIKFESKWVEGKVATGFTKTILRGTTDLDNVITTAAQLAFAKTAGTDYTIIGEYDLDGTNSAWTSVTGFDSNIAGAQYYRFSNSSAAERAIEGSAVIQNLKGANGLIADWNTATANKTISNFTFKGTNAVTATTNVATGLLVGSVTPAANGIIDKIVFEGTNTITPKTAQTAGVGLLAGAVSNTTAALTIKNINVKAGTVGATGKGTTTALAAVIGKYTGTTATNELTIANVQVASGVNVIGFKNIGGIIGEIGVGKVTFAAMKKDGSAIYTTLGSAYAADNIQNVSNATLTTYRVDTSAPYSSVLPTYGQFFGAATTTTAATDITIMGAMTKTSIYEQDWAYYLADTNGEYKHWDIYRFYNEIGHCGYTPGANNVTITPAFSGFTNISHTSGTTYGTTKTLKGSVATTAPTDNASTLYYGYVKQP